MAQLRRLGYLWRSAHEHAHDEPDLSRAFVRQLLAYADREGVVLQQRVLQRVCCKCCTLLIPGINSTVSQRRCSRRPAARRRELRVRCHHCGHMAAFAMAAKPSGRAGLAADNAASAPAAARGAPAPGKSAQSGPRGAPAAVAAQAGRKTKGRNPPAQPPAPAPAAEPLQGGASTGLFGFDFVPL